MKRFSLILIAGWCGLMLHAQTNLTGPVRPASATTRPPAEAAPRAPTEIYSDSGDFDGAARQVVYHGHVRVDDPQMKLTCAQLTANVPESGGRVSRLVAETNVVIDSTNKGKFYHVTGDKAVYIYNVQDGVTNETVTLTGYPQPRVEDAQGTQVADVITWDRANNGFHFFGNYHMVLHQSPGGATGAILPAQIITTNFPPGTNENIEKNASNPPAADF